MSNVFQALKPSDSSFEKPTKNMSGNYKSTNEMQVYLYFTFPNLPGYTAIPMDVPCHASPIKPNWGPQTDAPSVVVSIVTPAPWMHGFEATARQVGETTMVGRWVAYPRLVLYDPNSLRNLRSDVIVRRRFVLHRSFPNLDLLDHHLVTNVGAIRDDPQDQTPQEFQESNWCMVPPLTP